ncbi:MAG TPA: glycosyltransferase 87 family protein, partial [Dehalococcoidia bacterium]|nr:glycosyltransferase 87 family protein [Dehalococcoidia bacterium]
MTRLPLGPTTIVWLAALGVAVTVVTWLSIRRGRPIWALVAIGTGMELIYIGAFAGAYPLHTLFPELTNFGEVEGLSRPAFGAYLLAQALLFAGAAGSTWLAARSRPAATHRILFGGAALFGLSLLPLYPFTAIDVFYYVILGRVWGLHGANPFVVPASAFPEDGFLHLGAQWIDFPSLYGPVWIYFSLPAAWLAAQNFLAGVYFFKVFSLVAHLASGWLICATVRRTATPSGEATALGAAAFWLWNPLVLHEGIGQGHNDLVLTALLLLGLYFVGRRWPIGAAALAAATLLKVTVLPLLPLTLRALAWDRVELRPKQAAQTDDDPRDRMGGPPARPYIVAGGLLAVVAACWLVAYLPFWVGMETLAFLDRLDFFAQSVPA